MKQIYITLFFIACISNWLMGQVLVLNNFQSGNNSCPLMEVRMTESKDEGFYTISYCNHGNTLATNVYIELQMSNDAQIVQSPYSVGLIQGGMYRINLPNTLASQCLDFDIKINVSNSNVVNCIRAYIYPNNPCQAMIDYYITNNLGNIMGEDDSDDNNDDDDANDIVISTISQNQDQRGATHVNPFGISTVNSIFEDNVMLSGSPIWDSILNVLTNSLITTRPNNGNITLSNNTHTNKGEDPSNGQNNDSNLEITKLVWSEYCKNNSHPITGTTTSAILGDRIPFVGVINGFSAASNTTTAESRSGNESNTNNLESIDQPSLEIAIYPNPFNTHTTIEIVGADFQNKTFILLDATGKTIKNIPFQSQKIILQKENLAQGLYFYQIVKDGQLEQVGKLIAY